MTATIDKLDTLLEHLQQLSGLQVCIKSFSPSILSERLLKRIPRYYNRHRTLFCDNVKSTRNEQCCQCDLKDVPAKAFAIRKPFIHRCHANASELIIPVVNQPAIATVLYLGQFRLSDDQPPELPLFTADQATRLLSLGWMVQRFFLYEAEFTTPAENSPDYRREQIIQIVSKNMRQGIQLQDLAKQLHLSNSRTSHLVKELTGKSFVDLKLELRIAMACRLLASTLLTVEHIAEETGFQDVRYFYRVFDRVTGLTPGHWRSKHQHAVTVP